MRRSPGTPAPAVVRRLGRVEYEPAWRAMQSFTRDRGSHTPDEIWLLEHPPVFTLGLAGRGEHVRAPGDTPVVKIDRGGQVTWHGPGQVVAYVLADLRRLAIGPKELVRRIEQAAIATLAGFGVPGHRRAGMPGVYVDDAKIAAIGLRISGGCSYHGLALNVDAELAPFARIDPCGYRGLRVTRLSDHGVCARPGEVGDRLADSLLEALYPRAQIGRADRPRFEGDDPGPRARGAPGAVSSRARIPG